MNGRSVVTGFMALALTVAGIQPASAQESSTPTVSAQSVESKSWIKLAGTKCQLNDGAGSLRLASYSLVSDAGQQYEGYLREGDRFVKTPYRVALVAPGQRWVAGIPGYELWKAKKKIDLIDQQSRRKYTIPLPALVRSAEWSPDGRTLLLTAHEKRRGELVVIGFITVNVADRVPRLVKVGPRNVASRFYFAGRSDRVLARYNDADDSSPKSRLAVYDLRGKPRRYYTGVGAPGGASATQIFSPSGRLFATAVRDAYNVKTEEIRIVDASTGKILHRIRGKNIYDFMGWYDDEHIIVKRARVGVQVSKNYQLFQRVDLSGKADLDLIKEKLVFNVAEYKPHLDWVDFVRPN
ncbi:hypothetical protein [Thermostaphylospora chromogena]|uniref:WD40-like Beta Propeller Repeat n=1 Tax=Thermostaphylospora chromogena TaxID=35622 RepID=A0A1H1BEH1_9ACTN|nr:hypothetical protein [Thermostaphylospora chromogena]SDQ50368.1 hypothetical protein SAMN04489764_0932 [Thermostaphylospora chromogena]